MRTRGAARGAALALTLTLAAGTGTAAAAAQPLPLTVHVWGSGTRTSLRLQPGYATVLRADRRIDTVAIGDPRLVAATPVRRGQEAYDLILQPQVPAGATNMVVWFGDLTTVWDLEIGPGLRTADLVFVVTGPARAAAPPPQRPAADAISAPHASAPSRPAGVASAGGASGGAAGRPTPSAPAARASSTAESDAAPRRLEVREAVADVAAVFQVARAQDGVAIHYRITNGGDSDLAIRPAGVLVRINGRLVPYALARAGADQRRPELLPRGGTETGVIEAPIPSARSVQLVFSLFPVASGDAPADARAPVTFQPSFSGVDALPLASSP